MMALRNQDLREVPPELEVAPVAQRLIESTLAAIMRQGIAGVTLDEIAREAGCSRATLYRHFPGKQQLLQAALESEVARAVSGLEAVLSVADDLETCIVSGMMFGVRVFAEHEPLRLLLSEDPDLVLPFLSFASADETMRTTAESVACHVATFGLSYDEGYRLGEWATRLVLSYATTPSNLIDMTDEADVRRLVGAFMLPAFEPASGSEVVVMGMPEARRFRN